MYIIHTCKHVLLCSLLKIQHRTVIKSKNVWQKFTFYSFSVFPQKQDVSVVKVKPGLLNAMQEANETGRGNQAIPVPTNTLLPVCWLHLPHVTSGGTK